MSLYINLYLYPSKSSNSSIDLIDFDYVQEIDTHLTNCGNKITFVMLRIDIAGHATEIRN